jgi:thiamine-monophosphate kinase
LDRSTAALQGAAVFLYAKALGYKEAMDEFDIIARFFAPLAGDGAFGLKDDAALITPPAGFDLVVTTDAISEGTDFFAFDPADTIAQKALRVNLSDLAAKGAQPLSYLLNLSLPHSIAQDWLAAFAEGLKRDQLQFGISLLGGDTGATEGPLTIAVTAFGLVPQGGMVRRKGARPGDAVYVTGTIGDAGGGLAIFKRERHSLTDTARDQLTARYRVPEPPVSFAHVLREIAHAAIDVSDGLMADLGHLASASGVRIVVEGEQVPLSDPLLALWGGNALLRAVAAGDDYQIAFIGLPGLQGPFTRIGHVEEGEGVDLLIAGKKAILPSAGYRHF